MQKDKNKQNEPNKDLQEMLKGMDIWGTFVHIKGSETSGKKEE